MVPVKVEDEVRAKPLLVGHFGLEGAFPVGGRIETGVGRSLQEKGPNVLHVGKGLVPQRGAFTKGNEYPFPS